MRFAALLIPVALAACGAPDQARQSSEKLAAMDVAEAPAPAQQGAAGAPEGAAPLKVAVPQMAYSYGYVFRLPEAAVGKAQDRHVALCDSLGPARCQVLAMQSAGGAEDTTAATLKLRVVSGEARRFAARLAEAVATEGGRAVSSTIEAEDVSKAIVDTEARLRQRELLVARLTEILRTRQGKASELVEAERSVAAAQEEIDQARAWLAELRGRVTMSVMDIRYESVAAGPAAARGGLGDAVAQSASAFVAGVSAILQLLIFLAPWALVLAGIAWLARRFGWLRRGRAADSEAPPPAA